jgi:Arylsulfotransferase (ASST)
MSDQQTRRQVLVRARAVAAGAVGMALAGYAGYRWPRAGSPAAAGGASRAAAQAARSASAQVHHFVSRPDLTPPVVTVTRSAGAPAIAGDRYIFLSPSSGPRQAGLLICDLQGGPVWFSPASGQRQRTDLAVQSFRGQPVLTWWEGSMVHGVGQGTSYIADASYTTVRTVQAGHGLRADLHEFVITPQDTALITAYRTRPADLSAIGGPAQGMVLSGVAQEIDIATGRVLFEWDSLDHVDVTETHQQLAGGTSKQPFDYFHINSIAVAPDGDLLISARNTWAVYKVARPGGRIAWRLGGKKSSFTMGPGTGFYWQHHARPHGAGMLSIFDDGAAPPEEKQSRAILVGLDTTVMRAHLRQAYAHPAGLRAIAMGNVELLPDGRAFVGWGAEPYFSEFAPGGELLLDGQFPAGWRSYRAFTYPWRGQPTEPPAAAARRSPDGGTQVYASWNGATEVASWTVIAGTAAASLTPAGSQERTGFETAIAVTSTGPYFAAVALDAAGRQLGRSPTVRLAAARR